MYYKYKLCLIKESMLISNKDRYSPLIFKLILKGSKFHPQTSPLSLNPPLNLIGVQKIYSNIMKKHFFSNKCYFITKFIQKMMESYI